MKAFAMRAGRDARLAALVRLRDRSVRIRRDASELSSSSDVQRTAVHGDTAVTSYRFVVRIRADDVDVNRRYRTTNVWMKRDSRWRIVAAHTAFVLDHKQAAQLAADPGT